MLIIAIQVTVVPPEEHSSSLQFYTKLRDSVLDCDHYKRSDEHVQHHFVWIVPEKYKSTEVPPLPNVEQHVRTIESIMSTVN